MIDTRAVMRSLPLVASVLGRKYGVKIEIGGPDAYTDGSVIRLPSLPSEVPETILAMTRGYLDHEAGHVRETDFNALQEATLSPIEMHVWNTLEDWRVERRLASIFPGCRQNFDWLIVYLFGAEAEDEPVQPAVTILNWLLLEVRSWDVQALSTKRDRLAGQMDTAFPGIRREIGHILQVVRSKCHSTQDAVNFAREIVRVLDRYASLPRKQITQDVGQTQEAESWPDKPIESERSDRDESESYAENRTETAGIHTLQKDNSSRGGNETHVDDLDEDHAQSAQKIIRDLINAPSGSLPQSLGEILESKLQATASQTAEKSITVAISKSKEIFPLSDDEVSEARKAFAALSAKLQGLLQTSVLNRTSSGLRGRLDTRQLYRSAISDPRLFRGNAAKKGIDTAVHILLDCSGSMVRRMKLASTACYAVASALAASKINVAVTAFPSAELPDGTYTTVAPIMDHGQQMHAHFDLVPAGSTPMGEALWWVLQNMLPLKENRKLILLVTDGDPDSLECALQAIEHAEKMGVETYGIGIIGAGLSAILPGKSVGINAMNELAPAMFKLLEGALFK